MATAAKLNGDALRSPDDARNGIVNPTPIRLAGVLAAAVVLADSSTTKERIQIPGITTLYVLVKLSAITGTLTVNGLPMLSDATNDDTVGTRKTIGPATALTITTTTAQEMSYTCKGEEYFEVECVVSGGGSDSATIEYIEVYGI